MKEEIINKFFTLGGNYKNAEKAKIILKEIDKYLEKHNQDGNEELREIKKILKAFEEELNFDDFAQAQKIIFPVEQRLTQKDSFNFYDTRITQVVITWAESFEKAEILANKALYSLEKYKNHTAHIRIKFFIHFNMLIRALKADFKEIDIEKDLELSIKLDRIFKYHLSEALVIAESNKELKKYKYALLIRKALHDREFQAIDSHLENIKELDKELYKAMKDSVMPYIAYAGSNISKNQLDIIIGKNVRNLRESLGITAKSLGKFLGYKESHMTSIERGERPLNKYQMYRIAKEYDVSTDTFFNIKETVNSSEKDLELEKLKMLSANLDQYELETINMIIGRMKLQKK